MMDILHMKKIGMVIKLQMVENILKYQECDRQIKLLEKESATMQEKKVMNEMIGIVKNAQNKMIMIMFL